MKPENVVAILTAAGRSSRMGRTKALLEWGDRPLIAHQVEVLSACREVIVVLGHEAAKIRPFVPDRPTVRVLENEGYDEGRSSSLSLAFRAIAGTPGGILIVAVDQPVSRDTLAAVLQGYRPKAALVQPSYEGKRGHPALFRGDLLGEMRAIANEPEGLRAVVARHRENRIEVPVLDPDVLLNLNTPEEVAKRITTGQLPRL